jgi:hypothetical protein
MTSEYKDFVWSSTVVDLERMEKGDLVFLVDHGLAKKAESRDDLSYDELWGVEKSRKHCSCYVIFLSRAVGPNFVEKKAKARIWYDETTNVAKLTIKWLDFLVLYSALWDEEDAKEEWEKEKIRWESGHKPWRVPVEARAGDRD